MDRISLDSYKKYLVDYYKYECDNNEICRQRRKDSLERQYTDELLNSIIDGTYRFIDKILESTDSIEKIIKDSGIENITDDSAIREVIVKIIEANPQSVADYKAGKDKARSAECTAHRKFPRLPPQEAGCWASSEAP